MSDLTGLKLTRSERLLVVSLSYLFTAPLVYSNGKKLCGYLNALWAEARRQIREEDQLEQRRREREQRARRHGQTEQTAGL